MAVVWLTLQQAANRVNVTKHTVKRWQAAGMVTRFDLIDGQQTRVVDEDVLLAWWRDRLDASPAHQYRLRRRAAEAGRTYTPPPRRPRQPAIQLVPKATAEELAEDQAEAERPRPYEPLEHMKPMAGRAEYSRLAKALRRTSTPCRDVSMFTADPTPADQINVLAKMCAECPIAVLCAAYMDAGRPTVGFWAGRPAGRISGIPTANGVAAAVDA